MEVLAKVKYGSHLYGTATEESDIDFKTIFLPSKKELYLNTRIIQSSNERVSETGEPIPPEAQMPAGGIENENIPLQRFATDFLSGQTYAMEVAFAIVTGQYEFVDPEFYQFCGTLVHAFKHRNLYSMAGFAMKQTFDYIHRAERLALVTDVLSAIDEFANKITPEVVPNPETFINSKAYRMDVHLNFNDGATNLLEFLTERFRDRKGFKTKVITNSNNTLLAFEVAGRIFGETTPIFLIKESLGARVREYGGRVNKAMETAGVDWKSISHAIRVFQQIIEYVETQNISFPRPNTWYLMDVKNGAKISGAEYAFQILRELDAKVLEMDVSTTDLSQLPELEEMVYQFILQRIG